MTLRLTLDALQVLDTIARRGSFAAAAAELHRVPSALTYTVRKLEQDLGVTVFDRSGHRASLTDAGRELLASGRHLLDAAQEIECRVRRIATGWETELRIALDSLLNVEALYPVLEDFYREGSGTRVRIHYEVLAGTWDALVSGRATLAVGAAGEAPTGAGFALRPLGEMEFVFAVAPSHPLARHPDPIPTAEVARHRAVAIGDTARGLPVRSSGLVSGQDVLAVPSLEAKISAQLAGLGCGYLPVVAAQPWLKTKKLVAKTVEGAAPIRAMSIAWNPSERGRALRWFLKRLDEDKHLQNALFEGVHPRGRLQTTKIRGAQAPRRKGRSARD